MKKFVIVLMVLGLVIGGSGLVQANTVVLTPADLTGPSPGTKYAWDWDADKPIGSYAQGGAPGFGDSSWYSDVSGSASGTGRPYTSFRFFPDNIFGGAIKVSDLDDIDYWSNWVGGAVDWQLKIYTKPSIGTSWFGQRANFMRGSIMDGSWHEWSANDLGVEWLQNRNGASTVDTYGVSWGDFLTAAGNEEILFIDIIASWATNSPSSYTYLDGVTIELNGDREHSMDLAVPEPTSLMLLGLGLIGLVGIGRKYKK